MKMFERSIDRPLPVFLATLLVVVAGLWCLSELPLTRAPKIEIPFTVVYVPWVGASARDVESEITIELDEGLSTLDDLRHLSSISTDGLSTHVLEFEDRSDMAAALRAVRDETDRAEAEFPDDSDPPVVEELSFDNLPIVFYTLRGSADLYRLREIAEDLAPELEEVAGVSHVEVFGGFEREVEIWADPTALAAHDLTLEDLARAVGAQSQRRPSGKLRGGERQQLIRSTGEFQNLAEIRDIPVGQDPGGTLHLRDVARVELGHVRLASSAWFDGEPSVTLIVKRQPDVNTVATVDALDAKVQTLRAELPPGVTIEASSDASVVIARMVSQLGTTAAFGLVLVILVLFGIFGLRQALLVGSVLPISLLWTFIGLYVFDMSISNISLFALILVLGLVVDGAIIVGEAIYAERESGAKPAEASKIAIGRVGLPVIAADLTTIAAFLPMLLMVGVMGQFMSVMPKVVCFAIVGSVFVDHFLLPAAAARLPVFVPAQGPEGQGLLPRVRRRYEAGLRAALRHPWSVLGCSLAAFLAAVGMYAGGAIESIFLPKTDRGRFTVNYALPLGTPLEETNRVGLLLAGHVSDIPELDHYVLTTGETGALATDGREGGRSGPEYGRINIELIDESDRGRSQSEIVRDLRTQIAPYAGVEIDLDELGEGPSVGAALALRVKGDHLDEVAQVARRVEQRLAGLEAATDLRVDYDRSRPEIRVEVDRVRAQTRFGVTPDQVANALLTTFYGIEVGRMWVDEERVDIRLQAPEDPEPTIDDVAELPLRTRSGDIVPLGEIASLHLDFGDNAIFRHNTQRSVTVRADAAEGSSSIALETAARANLASLVLPPGISLEFGGETEERDRSYASLWSALKWGLLLIYVIMAIQFNSVLQPLVVLFSVPLSVVGVTLGLLLTGLPFSFMVFIGIVSLTGIVVNDGIVMVDSINRLRRAGMPIGDALLRASSSRLRPVLLTTFTTIAGLLPLTLNIVDGGEFWVPLGVAIIAGLIVGSALTLFVVPVSYSLLARRRNDDSTIPLPS